LNVTLSILSYFLSFLLTYFNKTLWEALRALLIEICGYQGRAADVVFTQKHPALSVSAAEAGSVT
jgi:hypothetical protein